jgi:hypothetical protein
LATALGLSVYGAGPANAVNGSIEICPYLPYLAVGDSQMVQDVYSWTLYEVDPAGLSVIQQQGRDRGCHVVSPIANAAYRVSLQTGCTAGGAGNFHLMGRSPTIWVPEGAAPVRARVDTSWSDC